MTPLQARTTSRRAGLLHSCLLRPMIPMRYLTDADALTRCAERTDIRFEDRPNDDPRVYVDGYEASAELRTETCAAAASAIAGWVRIFSSISRG